MGKGVVAGVIQGAHLEDEAHIHLHPLIMLHISLLIVHFRSPFRLHHNLLILLLTSPGHLSVLIATEEEVVEDVVDINNWALFCIFLFQLQFQFQWKYHSHFLIIIPEGTTGDIREIQGENQENI